MSEARPALSNTVRGLWGMARPLTLTAPVMAWLLGVATAFGSGARFDVAAFGWGLAAMILATASIHYTNEYADFETDALTFRTPYSGGSGVLPSGLVPRDLAMRAAWVSLLAGLLVQGTALLLGVHTWPVAVMLVVGIVGGWMYSLPPLKLAWRGWGELDNAVLGGLVAPLHGYGILTGRVDGWVMLTLIPFTLLVFTNLLAVTWPDRVADAIAGKRTLATRWPARWLRALHAAALLIAFGTLAWLALTGRIPLMVAITGGLALPAAVWGAIIYTRRKVSRAAVHAMVIMMVLQAAAWLAIGLGVDL